MFPKRIVKIKSYYQVLYFRTSDKMYCVFFNSILLLNIKVINFGLFIFLNLKDKTTQTRKRTNPRTNTHSKLNREYQMKIFIYPFNAEALIQLISQKNAIIGKSVENNNIKMEV